MDLPPDFPGRVVGTRQLRNRQRDTDADTFSRGGLSATTGGITTALRSPLLPPIIVRDVLR